MRRAVTLKPVRWRTTLTRKRPRSSVEGEVARAVAAEHDAQAIGHERRDDAIDEGRVERAPIGVSSPARRSSGGRSGTTCRSLARRSRARSRRSANDAIRRSAGAVTIGGAARISPSSRSASTSGAGRSAASDVTTRIDARDGVGGADGADGTDGAGALSTSSS